MKNETYLDELDPVALLEEAKKMYRRINSPITENFLEGVKYEAAFQQQRFGASTDRGKSPLDWFWLIGFLAQKAAFAAINGDAKKAKHHTISTAAALLNWHKAIVGDADATVRPGINPEDAYSALQQNEKECSG